MPHAVKSHIYRLSADPERVDAAGPPPRHPSRRLVHVEWDIPEAEFTDVPVLRQWFRDHGIDDITEQGITVWEEPLPLGRGPYWCTGMGWINWRGGRGELTRSHPCEECGMPVTLVEPSPQLDADSVALVRGQLARSPLCFVGGPRCVTATPDLVADLRSEGLDEGLVIWPLDPQGEALVLSSDRPLGGPAYPFGPVPCRTCGRASRGGGGERRFVRPKYAFDLTFDREPPPWSWSTIYGQGMPLVSYRVARHLLARMPALEFLPHGRPVSPGTFLPERYR